MITNWDAIADDDLKLIDKTVDFLQSEFCASGVDPIWSTEYFKWKLGNINPAGAGHISVACSNNSILGTVSLTRKRILINGVEYIGGEVGDSYTSNSARRNIKCSTLSLIDRNPNSYINKSIFGRLASDVRTRAEKNGISIIYGTPNKNALPGWTKRLGYKLLTNYDNHLYVRPTVKFLVGRLPFIRPMKSLVYSFENLLLFINGLKNKSSELNRFSFEDQMPSKEEINELWTEVRPIHGFSFVRDGAYWVHRYTLNPLAKYLIISLYYKEKLIGLTVARKLRTAEGLVILYVAEWMFNPRFIRLEILLARLVWIYRKEDVDALAFYSDGSLYQIGYFFRYGLVKKNKVPIMFADTKDADLLNLSNLEFHFNIGNTDAI